MGLMSLKTFDFFKSNKILAYQRFYKLKKIVVYNFLGSFMTSLPDTSHTGGVYTDLKPTKILSQYTLLLKKVATGPDLCQKNVFLSQYRILRGFGGNFMQNCLIVIQISVWCINCVKI